MTAPPYPAMATEQARAKLNLDLHVTGRRPDGYHEIDSLIVFAELGDRVTLAPKPGLSEPELTVWGPFGKDVPVDQANLVYRAATLLADTLDRPADVTVVLKKELPPAAGVGGGSSDAAATLRALTQLWAPIPDALDLMPLALDLGADVPACLANRPVRVRGIGEVLRPVAGLPALPIVLVNPGVDVPTAAVFAAFRAMNLPFSEPRPLPPCGTVEDLVTVFADRPNDLQPAAIEICPEIDAVLAALIRQPECLLARMSGSGGTCFGIFESDAAAARAARALEGAQPNWWVAKSRVKAA